MKRTFAELGLPGPWGEERLLRLECETPEILELERLGIFTVTHRPDKNWWPSVKVLQFDVNIRKFFDRDDIPGFLNLHGLSSRLRFPPTVNIQLTLSPETTFIFFQDRARPVLALGDQPIKHVDASPVVMSEPFTDKIYEFLRGSVSALAMQEYLIDLGEPYEVLARI